ncbi:hypothetical protein [Prochlorococcus marinus]|uniref:Uncharacterized protein n=1 Tax=Prochlorococcus marinus (strain MIT 9211) TaxID=93059 RepID=A9BE23_PROM4|nr:hypothetical protein [Prochlorococcus marinus]ABX08333.1 Hypothetical protein P9211_04021 [Prochlorococcus marinus str. MIT 9211]
MSISTRKLKGPIELAVAGFTEFKTIVTRKETIISYFICYGIINIASVKYAIQNPDSFLGFQGELILNSIISYFFCTAIYVILENNRKKGMSLFSIGFTPFLKKSFALWGVNIIASIRIILGTILLILPGIVLALRYIYISEIKAIEQINNKEVLRKSTELSKINRWRYISACLLILIGSTILRVIYLSIVSKFDPYLNQNFLLLIINEFFGGFITCWLYTTGYIAYLDATESHSSTKYNFNLADTSHRA